MKTFPYKVLFACIFLPPILYILTITIMEGYLQKHLISNLDRIVIHDQEALLEGSYPIKDEINRNLGEYLSANRFLYAIGVRTDILVKTKDDKILYPAQMSGTLDEPEAGLSKKEVNYTEIAAENYKILNEGLILSASIRIKHNDWLSNSILVFYILIAVFVVRLFIRRSQKEFEKTESEHLKAIQDLTVRLKENESDLIDIRRKEDEYLKNITLLKKERENLSTDIDDLLEEVERLESGLHDQRNLKNTREEEANQLREEIEELRGKLAKPGKKKKKKSLTEKRFKVLYKNLVFTDRAIEGFDSLTDDFQLKAEEIIHRLNEDDSKVPVRRKVFGKGGKMNILETEFSYSGRIYFQKDSQSGTRVVAIGTKKTQDQDLSFLEREVR